MVLLKYFENFCYWRQAYENTEKDALLTKTLWTTNTSCKEAFRKLNSSNFWDLSVSFELSLRLENRSPLKKTGTVHLL